MTSGGVPGNDFVGWPALAQRPTSAWRPDPRSPPLETFAGYRETDGPGAATQIAEWLGMTPATMQGAAHGLGLDVESWYIRTLADISMEDVVWQDL